MNPVSRTRGFVGSLIHCIPNPQDGSPTLEILQQAVIVLNPEGTHIDILIKQYAPVTLEGLWEHPELDLTILGPGEFMIPGFVDTHNHAAQWAMRGLGQNLHILDWLEQITFPQEAKFSDPVYAERVYSLCVDGFLRQGITTASYYGSVHGEATKILANLCLAKGQRVFVGKCNMTRNSPDSYRDASVEESLRVTRECIDHIRSIDPKGELVKHILTPRFAISCTAETLDGLGKIAKENPDLPIQTHFNEAEQEIHATKELFPEFGGSEADLYEHFGLLGPRTILAHCCHMTEYEMKRIKELECGVAHCPVSNMTVGGGFMAAPVREFMRRGIKVGLGTDSGGGFSSSILDAMRQAMIASHAREKLSEGKDKGLSIAEVFYLATLGGAEVCGLGEKIGNFEMGKEFDALVIGTVNNPGIMTPVQDDDDLRTAFDKWVMTGDDRNIKKVFVRGRLVKSEGTLGAARVEFPN
ncbi:hypothetical protein QBC38DRAFT_88763 [Podospora fimiseda]|uniref:Guanine deaminase n=1 Tax=Podospora fimiseda TaxID=252190 RepID=A0AAN7BDZ1_9PEZI|nr:hypothetical protein QBC38DRAFT_88763 [Podospora fimiseda]